MVIKTKFFYGYWIVAACFVALALNSGLTFYGFSILNKLVGDEFGWSRGAVTTAFSFFNLAAAAVSPIAGRFTDKRGTRQTLFIGTLFMAFTLILLSKTSAIWNYYPLHFFLGIGYVLLGVVPTSTLISIWFYKKRGMMQGIAFTGIGFGGFTLSPFIGNFLLPHFGWQGAYLVMGLIALSIMLPLTFFIIKDHPYQKNLTPYGREAAEVLDHQSSKEEGSSGLNVKEALGTSTFWIIAITLLVYGVGMTASFQNQMSILIKKGFTVAMVVKSIGIVGFFSGIGKFLFGYLCDRINTKYLAASSYALTAISLVALIQASDNIHVYLYAVANGLGQGGWAPILAMLVASYFGTKHLGAMIGIFQLALMMGVGLGPMVAGFSYDMIVSYRLILLVLALLCFASTPVITLIKKPHLIRNA